MKTDEREELAALYTRRYEELGRHIKTLGWNTEADQRLRFDVLCDIADLRGASICDVGCGFGDLVPYLERRFGTVEYTGVDITPALIGEAQKLHPRRRFLCADILEDGFHEEFDYFLLSGALNYRVRDNWALTTAMMTHMFHHARRGIAVNFLTSYVNFEREHNYHHKPEAVFSFAQTLTRAVILRHDYPLWEFTIYLYKKESA